MNLINSKVYFSIQEVLYFLYPEFRVLPELMSLPTVRKVIFSPPLHQAVDIVEESLAQKYPEWILSFKQRSYQADYEFIEVEDYLELVSSLREIRYAKDLPGKCRRLENREFAQFLALSSVLGRWYREIFSLREKIYTLFDSFSLPKGNFLATYFSLVESHPPGAVFSSVLSYLEKSVGTRGIDRDDLSAYYKRVVKKGQRQFISVPKALKTFLESKVPDHVRFLNFYLDIKGSN